VNVVTFFFLNVTLGGLLRLILYRQNELAPNLQEAGILKSITMKHIENHKKAAKHLEEAAKHHHDAAKLHEAGNHEKAHHSTLKAHGETAHAMDVQKEILKEHSTEK